MVHFFRWQFQSIWDRVISADTSDGSKGFYSGSFSMIKGLMAPQTFFKDTTKISAAFRGPEPTVISFDMTPTFYIDEINNLNYSGYRLNHRALQRGSVVNERTLMNYYTYNSKNSEDFSIRFQTYISSNVYNVRVLRLKSMIDVLAQIMGLLAGLSFICRFLKFFFMKCKVFLHLDREYNIYFKEDKRLSVVLNPPEQK